MRELAVAQKDVWDEQGNPHTYSYSILIGEIEFQEGFFCESYGVRIEESGGESGEIPNVTVSISRIDDLLDLLLRNTVTPCTLRDVVEDWL